MRHPLAPSLALLLLPSLALADVLVVDGSGAGDHATIQAAVDAAGEGDLILVRPGEYAGFELDGKGLVVQADGPGVEITVELGGPTIRVAALGPGQTVRLRGVSIQQAVPFVTTSDVIVELANNVGSVVFEDVLVSDGGEPGNGFLDSDAHALAATACADVLLVRCTLVGHGTLAEFGGGTGLLVAGSKVRVHESTVRGVDGDDAISLGLPGGSGASGMVLQNGSVFASGTTFVGGDAGQGLGIHGQCIDGAGGHGVHVQGGHLTARDCTFVPGPELCFGPFAEEIAGDPSDWLRLATPARSFTATSPVREGGVLQLGFLGEPGDLVLLFQGEEPGPNPVRLGFLGAPGPPLADRLSTMGTMGTVVVPLEFTSSIRQ